MVIIKCNVRLKDEDRRKLEINIHDQAADGVIVLPYFCELLNKVPADETIKVVYEQKDDSEKERDAKEFSRRLMGRWCSTCLERYAPPSLKACRLCDSGSLYRKV